MIRNHAEAIVGSSNTKDLTNMIGFNFRMTEITVNSYSAIKENKPTC